MIPRWHDPVIGTGLQMAPTQDSSRSSARYMAISPTRGPARNTSRLSQA